MPGSGTKNTAKRRHFEADAQPHLDTLYSMALRLTRVPVDAEDLVQDTLVRAYRFYDRFEAGTNFKAWLLRIQMNTFVNRYRRATRERQVFDGPMAEPVGEGDDCTLTGGLGQPDEKAGPTERNEGEPEVALEVSAEDDEHDLGGEAEEGRHDEQCPSLAVEA